MKKQSLLYTYQDDTPLLRDVTALQERAKQQGYLYFRQLLNCERIMEVRLRVLALLYYRQLLDLRYSVVEGVVDPRAVNELQIDADQDTGLPNDLHAEIYSTESLHALAHTPALLEVMELLMGEEAFLCPRMITNLILPHRQVKTPVEHQDAVFQTPSGSWTAWLPLGDCSRSQGALAMLAGSHLLDIMDLTGNQDEVSNGWREIYQNMDLDWHVGDFQMGDVLVYNTKVIHKASPNQKPNQIHLSCETHYQRLSEPVDPELLEPQRGSDLLTWDDIYQDWNDTSLMHYWRNKKLKLKKRTESYTRKSIKQMQ